MSCATHGAVRSRGRDLNTRPSGYEPDELPGCSTPHQGFEAGVSCPIGLRASSPILLETHQKSRLDRPLTVGNQASSAIRRQAPGLGIERHGHLELERSVVPDRPDANPAKRSPGDTLARRRPARHPFHPVDGALAGDSPGDLPKTHASTIRDRAVGAIRIRRPWRPSDHLRVTSRGERSSPADPSVPR